MVYFLTHDLHNIALDSNSHHKTDILPINYMIMVIKCAKLYNPEAYNGLVPNLPTMLQY